MTMVKTAHKKEDLMAEPENCPPPSRPDPNTAPPNFLFAVQIVPRGGHHLGLGGTGYLISGGWASAPGKVVPELSSSSWVIAVDAKP